jgi:transcriptional regulator GlxA family with amidase domain
MRRAVAVVIHPGFQLLDAAGPTTAFEIAERFRPGSYHLKLLAPGGGEVESSSGLSLSAKPLEDVSFDTAIVSGGEIVRSTAAAEAIVAWLRRTRARRIASVCSGAYLLAAAGLLDGRRATTHWGSTDDFSRRYPKVKLDAERIFIRDGDVWTSAGISAGIDLALALIEDDLGPEVARRTAQQLVVHQRRPGGQSQFSALVELGGRTGRFAPLIAWMRAHLAEPLTVERLADHVAMSRAISRAPSRPRPARRPQRPWSAYAWRSPGRPSRLATRLSSTLLRPRALAILAACAGPSSAASASRRRRSGEQLGHRCATRHCLLLLRGSRPRALPTRSGGAQPGPRPRVSFPDRATPLRVRARRLWRGVRARATGQGSHFRPGSPDAQPQGWHGKRWGCSP